MIARLLATAGVLALCVAPAAAGNLNVPSLGGDVSNGGMNGTTLTIQPGAVTAAKMAPGAAAGNLGYTPLAPAANLSDVANSATARANLGAAASGANGDITSLANLPSILGLLPSCTQGSSIAPVAAGQAFQCAGIIMIAQ